MMDTLDPVVTEALRSWRVLLDAGIGSAEALQSSGSLLHGAARSCFLEASARTAKGDGIAIVLEAMAPILTQGERMILAAGWSAGRIEATIDAVVQQRDMWRIARRRIIGKMLKPAFILLIASFVAPLPVLIAEGDVLLYLVLAAIPILIAGGAVAAAAVFFHLRATAPVMNADGSPVPPTQVDKILLVLPGVGHIERQRSVAEFGELLANLLSAGAPIVQALDAVARAARNGCYRVEMMRLSNAASKGHSFSASIQEEATGLWPPEFGGVVAVGEQSGRLDATLSNFARNAREKYTRAIELFADWLPRLIYGIIALFVIWNIFRFVMIYINAINSAMPQGM